MAGHIHCFKAGPTSSWEAESAGASLVAANTASTSPAATRGVCIDKASPRSSQDMKSVCQVGEAFVVSQS